MCRHTGRGAVFGCVVALASHTGIVRQERGLKEPLLSPSLLLCSRTQKNTHSTNTSHPNEEADVTSCVRADSNAAIMLSTYWYNMIHAGGQRPKSMSDLCNQNHLSNLPGVNLLL